MGCMCSYNASGQVAAGNSRLRLLSVGLRACVRAPARLTSKIPQEGNGEGESSLVPSLSSPNNSGGPPAASRRPNHHTKEQRKLGPLMESLFVLRIGCLPPSLPRSTASKVADGCHGLGRRDSTVFHRRSFLID